jgi:flagellar biosynthesis GTPase FlhF
MNRESLFSAGYSEKCNRAGTIYFQNNEGEIAAKVCSKCAEIKDLEQFSKASGRFSGKKPECKTCDAKKNRKHYQENRERYRSAQKEYYENNKESLQESMKRWKEENSEKIKESNRKWYEENKERQLELAKAWRTENKQRHKELVRRWEKENKERIAAKIHRRRARKKALPDTLSPDQTVEILNSFGNGCALTGSSDIHLDHVIPLSIGHGGTTYGNMIPLRSDLNISKHDRNIFEWFDANRQRFNLEQERFDRLIEWLGKANGMTVEEYRDYVYECHANPNVISDEIDTQDGENRQAI